LQKEINFHNSSLPLEVSSLLNELSKSVNNIVDCNWKEVIEHNKKSKFYGKIEKEEDRLYLGLCHILKGNYADGINVLKTVCSSRVILWIINNPQELRSQALKIGYI